MAIDRPEWLIKLCADIPVLEPPEGFISAYDAAESDPAKRSRVRWSEILRNKHKAGELEMVQVIRDGSRINYYGESDG